MTSYALILAGAIAVLVATLIGGFGAGWTFLPPLPFYPAGQWSVWSESVFLRPAASRRCWVLRLLHRRPPADDDDLRRASGGRSVYAFLRGREPQAPPPQAIAATVIAIDGLISCAVGSTIVIGLLGRTYDHTVGIDALVAKNLVYFFGHSIANLSIYLAAAAIYVLVPLYAGRPYETTKVFVAGWLGSLVFIATAYSHHLYMDFVQPTLGRHHFRSRLVRRLDSGRGHHDLLDDDADLGLPLPVDARLDAALRRLRRLGDRRRWRSDRLADPDQLPPPQHDLGRRPLPHLPGTRPSSSGGLPSSPIFSNGLPVEPPRAPPAPGRSR